MPNRSNRRAGYVSPAVCRKRRADIAGLALIAGCLAGFAGMFTAAYQIDKARGISYSQSLAANGFGSRLDRPASAEEAKASGAADIMAELTRELRKGGCKVRQESATVYEVESCK
jgi:hypothetical protein